MLYYLAAKFDVEALAIMTVSDSLVTGEETTAEERQTTFNEMIEVGLETVLLIKNAWMIIFIQAFFNLRALLHLQQFEYSQ